MKAGFAKEKITPPLGTRMSGFGGRDKQKGCERINDDLFVRVLYLNNGEEELLIAAFDLLFFAREYADALKSALGRVLDLSPRKILINTSHTHSGPCVDRWGYNMIVPPDLDYLDMVKESFINASIRAKGEKTDVTIWSGTGKTILPVSRRKPDGKGGVEWRPYPEGIVCKDLPICFLRDLSGEPICLIYSVSCHPSTMGGWTISADYPGAACRLLDSFMGKECSLFLQGAGGDCKACVIADGKDDLDVCWRSGTPDDIEKAGKIAADEVMKVVETGLTEGKAFLKSVLMDVKLPLKQIPNEKKLLEMLQSDNEVKKIAADLLLKRYKRFGNLPDEADILVHGINLAEDVRFIAVEGELVGEHGLNIIKKFSGGVTFPLGYSNGTGLYLPTSRMLREGGYEAESYYEYGFAAQLREGIEDCLADAVKNIKLCGIS